MFQRNSIRLGKDERNLKQEIEDKCCVRSVQIDKMDICSTRKLLNGVKVEEMSRKVSPLYERFWRLPIQLSARSMIDGVSLQAGQTLHSRFKVLIDEDKSGIRQLTSGYASSLHRIWRESSPGMRGPSQVRHAESTGHSTSSFGRFI